MIETKNIALGYNDKMIFEDISIQIPENKITVLIGANGSGKSTLLKAMSRLLIPKYGGIYIENKNIVSFKPKELAQKITILPQSASAPGDLSIYDLVKQGRYPYHTLVSRWTKLDEEVVSVAIQKMGLWDVRNERLSNLSGGQKQRAWIALALSQNTDFIFLDEPTNHLDVRYQIEILELLKELNLKDKKTIIMVLHDINYAIRYAHHIVALKDGRVYADGCKEDVINEELINHVFEIECHLLKLKDDVTICVPY